MFTVVGLSLSKMFFASFAFDVVWYADAVSFVDVILVLDFSSVVDVVLALETRTSVCWLLSSFSLLQDTVLSVCHS